MKKIIIIAIISALLLALSSSLYAVDRVSKNNDSTKNQSEQKADKRDKANYQDFIDRNNNGIDDKIEKQQKETTRVEPKREPEVQKREPAQTKEKYVPQAPKTKQPVKQSKPAQSSSNPKKEKSEEK
ncbi:MAG: hypothetical protein GWO41_14850 [candidate division Zixibacteria bacterium]|nr:hypothetical protein [candidate division Zixibacteria bacterium]NIR66316.1 hypothetical protein [candidate division Zixibacteria bacterium]NIS17653.1 hypothetical protein [candidate division Zixibacteria bacterium]NIS47903.1 hypothetical protein [candidate division Zixibacteria bacterium]NIT53971.1 hypothetical protein [candidate division Zixibacteria bacterium]